MNKNLLIGLGVFLAVVVVGFFLIGAKPKISSNKISNSPISGAPVKEFDISAKEYAFDPSTISVNKGENVKIVFTNNGTTAHNFTIGDLNIATNTINPGQSDSITFSANQTGTFKFYCSIDGHRGFGMEGTLEVK